MPRRKDQLVLRSIDFLLSICRVRPWPAGWTLFTFQERPDSSLPCLLCGLKTLIRMSHGSQVLWNEADPGGRKAWALGKTNPASEASFSIYWWRDLEQALTLSEPLMIWGPKNLHFRVMNDVCQVKSRRGLFNVSEILFFIRSLKKGTVFQPCTSRTTAGSYLGL